MFPDNRIIKVKIPYPQAKALWGWVEHPTVTIYPVGDLHLGSIETNEKAWEAFVDHLSKEPDSYIVVVGDMLDNATKGSVGNPFEQRYRPMEAKNILTEYMRPIADKILCGVRGNHENRSVKDVDLDPLYDVFCRLNIEDRYRAGTAFLNLNIGERPDGDRQRAKQSYNIVVTHGTGGGKQAGSGINNQHRFAYSIDGCDVLITGHTHTPAITKPCKTVFDARQVTVRTDPFACVQCVSWLTYGGYPLQKMLAPQASWDNNVPQKIELGCTRNQKQIRATM